MPLLSNSSRLGAASALFLGSFLQEDLAVLAGAAYISEAGLPWPIAFAGLLSGFVASDLAVYGLGRAAGRIPRLKSLLITERVQNAGDWLSEHLLPAVFVCHVVPGLLWATFIACGWFRVPVRRFALASLVTAAGYIAVLLYLLVQFGQFIRQDLGYWAWGALAALLLASSILVKTRPGWATLSKTVSRFNDLVRLGWSRRN
jgi:membrane protein DedA with SNARE-associated domain